MEIRGATIWLRQTIESDIFYWKPDKWFKIWFFIVNKVNHADTRLFERGSNFTTYKEISLYTKATKHQIDQFMRWAKEQSMLTTRKTTRGMVVTVLNYAKYQDYIKTKNDTPHETKTKHKRNTNDTINNNYNNYKNDKNIAPKDFFANDQLRTTLTKNLLAKNTGVKEQVLKREIDKFCDYWTEPNKTGTKVRWELEKTFEVTRRLKTWLNNFNKFS